MVNRRISEDLKKCALRLWNHGWDVQHVCEAFGISRNNCYRWRQILEEHGTIKRLPSPLSAIQDLFAVDADLFLDEVCTWLGNTTTTVFLHFPVLSSKQASPARFFRSLLLNVMAFVGRRTLGPC
ncbi:hypothetical protein M405DRAFT_932220 [Rhizopogon salebrosus TDB-379]|nr:hypothetical protein M405DRAFT_932220 [Rhizopogon salebrosus TDB-379]